MTHVKTFKEHFRKRAVFSFRDVMIFLGKKGISRNYAKLLVHNLYKKGELKKISRGFYSFYDDVMVTGFAFTPFYYGLQEALSLRKIWQQQTNPVIITTRKVRSGMRNINNARVIVRKMRSDMFFGFELIKYYDFWIPVSDNEKTLIDFVYFREPLDMVTLRKLKKKINKIKLRNYLKRVPLFVQKRIKKIITL